VTNVIQVERKASNKVRASGVGKEEEARSRSADMKEGYRRPSAQRWSGAKGRKKVKVREIPKN